MSLRILLYLIFELKR